MQTNHGFVLQEVVPLENIIVESLHLVIQSGNAWIDATRNIFQFLRGRQGKAGRAAWMI